MGATPYTPENYETKLYGKPSDFPMKSVRQTKYGYKNSAKVHIRFDSFTHYVEDLERAVNQGCLSMEKELYSDVRFRKSARVRNLLNEGIQYLEFRNFDINPFASVGILVEDIDFIKLFIITILLLPDVQTQEEVDLGNEYNEQTASAHPFETSPYKEEGLWLLDQIAKVANILDQQLNTNYLSIVMAKRDPLINPKLTLASQLILQASSHQELVKFGIKLAHKHSEHFACKPYLLHGFESYELSSQDLIKEAINLGLQVSIVDESDNLIQLRYQDHQEYIRKANMTQYDSLISYFLMENKVATKNILKQHTITTPKGNSFQSQQLAYNFFAQLPDSGFVVKPKSTNYGVGISIFQKKPDYQTYQDAVDEAFNEDDTIIIEDFASGKEYRFYVQNGKVLAITERIAAHVNGDGHHSIQELMAIENQNPLRGKQHQAPLTELIAGEAERIHLANQGLNFDSIPKKDQVVFLRSNSNVSTGGIPVDRTDEVHLSYHHIAIKTAEALGAVLCGVDMMIIDKNQPANSENYSIIEANFNPAMMIHRFPGIGQERYLARELLNFLFPELFKK